MTVTLHVCRDTAAVLAATPAAAPAAAPAVAPAAARSKDAGVMAETSRTRVSEKAKVPTDETLEPPQEQTNVMPADEISEPVAEPAVEP